MRAFALTDTDTAPTVIEVPTPEPAAGEVRVRIAAASVNGFDLGVASGRLTGMMEHRFPVVLGKDFAGTIDAVGEGVEQYAVGDRVFGVVTKDYVGDGSFGEFVTVPVAVGIAPLPAGIAFEVGAALGLAGVTAAQAVDAAAVQAGQTVLVVGATGGVGTQAVQLAAAAGARVIATASTDAERELVTGLGADETVDHTGDLGASVREAHPSGVDALLHFAGDPMPLRELVRDGGAIASTLIMSPDQLLAEHAVVRTVYAHPDRAALERVAARQADGTTRVTVHATYPLARTAEAFEEFRSGTRGKVVVTSD